MSARREMGHKREKQTLLTGIGGLVLLVGLVLHNFVEIVGGIMFMMGAIGSKEAGIRVGIVGMLLITFGLIFHEPFRAMVGCTMALIGIMMWRFGDQSTPANGAR